MSAIVELIEENNPSAIITGTVSCDRCNRLPSTFRVHHKDPITPQLQGITSLYCDACVGPGIRSVHDLALETE